MSLDCVIKSEGWENVTFRNKPQLFVGWQFVLYSLFANAFFFLCPKIIILEFSWYFGILAKTAFFLNYF